MKSRAFFQLLKDYLIENLVGLEDRLEGQGVFIDEENGWFVELKIDRIMLQDVSKEDIEISYCKYNCVRPGLSGEGFLQSLNYDEFLPYENHFRGVVNYYMDIMEQRIFDSFKDILNSKLDNTAELDIFSSRAFDEFEEKLTTLKRYFTPEGDYLIYHYDNSSVHPKISEVMRLVLQRQENFCSLLKQEVKGLNILNDEELEKNHFSQGFFKTPEGFKNFLKFQEGLASESHDKKFTLYSFVFQKMLEKKIIEKITHLEFFNWLRDHDYIDKDVMERFLINGSMKSLQKSSTKERTKEFNRIFETS